MAGKRWPNHGMFASLLRDWRTAANLTQEELAGRAGLSVEAVGALERGDRRSPRPSTVESLMAALQLDAPRRETFIAAARGGLDAQALLASMPAEDLPPRAPLPAGSRMPLAANPLFVGRGDDLLRIAAALRRGDATVAIGQVVASTGLGGLGKTQLAVELAHRYGQFFAGGVFWLSFASANEVPLQVAACAGPGFERRSVEERVELVKDSWQSATPRLLVFDNCEEEGLLDAWRPSSGGCRVLVTSRRAEWSPTLGVTTLPLDLLPRADSVELLRRYRSDLAAGDPRLDTIAHELGDLPLALHLAGSYLRTYRTEIGLDDYLTELRRSDVVQHASLLGAGLDDSVSPTHHVQGVAQTFALCLRRLDRDREVDRVAIAVLARVACMAPGEPVPSDLLASSMEDVDPLLRADGSRRLSAVGLMEVGEGWLRLHRLLVQFVRQEGLDLTAHPAVSRALIACREDAADGHLTGSALSAVVRHLVYLAEAAVDGDAFDGCQVAELCDAAGQALRSAGDLTAARPFVERAVDIKERVLGPDDLGTADSLNNLAMLLRQRGELDAARPLYERALIIYERAMGPDHPNIAIGLANLAALLREQGELDAARPLLERALAICEQVSGPDHCNTATILNGLARLLHAQDQPDAARPLFERALAIRERALGPDHPQTAVSLNDLALVYRAGGDVAAATSLLERALAIWKRVLGSDHPLTARSLHDLAVLLHAEGDAAAARPLFERALAIRERVLRPDHPDTVATRRALAELDG